MTGAGSTWSAWITVEPGRISIDLVTTHTVTVDGSVVPVCGSRQSTLHTFDHRIGATRSVYSFSITPKTMGPILKP